jgi:hypothetical protein
LPELVQETFTVLPAFASYLPASHRLHAVAAWPPEYSPVSHRLQRAEALDIEKDPGPQSLQATAPTME